MSDRCDFPGCSETKVIVVPVGPDWPSVLEPETLEDILVDGTPSYVTGVACESHVYAVRRRLMERHQPRRSASREGRA